MSTRPIELDERIGNWKRAYDMVLPELVRPAQRDILSEMTMVEGVPQLASYMSLARNVMAGERTAAIVASLLVTSGIRPLVVAEMDEQG